MKRFLAIFMSVVMALTYLPMTGLADGEGYVLPKDEFSDTAVAYVESSGVKTYYDTLEEAAAAATGEEVVTLIADVVLETPLVIKKSISITTDGNGDKTINVSKIVAKDAYAIQFNPDPNVGDKVSFKGASETSRIIVDGGKLADEEVAAAAASKVLFQRIDTAEVENVVFKNAVANATDGGAAVYVASGVKATFDKCVFDNNVNASVGGALQGAQSTNNPSVITVKDSTFTNNKATKGAVIRYNGEIHFTGCTFSGNNTTASGETDISTGNSAYTDRTVDKCVSDKTKAETVNGNVILGTGENKNTFANVKVAAPTLKADTFDATGEEYTMAQIFDGWNADAFDYTIKAPAEEIPAGEGITLPGDDLYPAVIKEAGEYTVELTLKEGYELEEEKSLTFTFTLVVPETTKVDAPTLKAETFEFKDAEYTLAEILNNWDADAFNFTVTYKDAAASEEGEVILPPDVVYAPIKVIGKYNITLTLKEGYELKEEKPLSFDFEIVEPIPAVAMIGDVKYATIAEAVAAAELTATDDTPVTVVIVADDTITSQLKISKNVYLTTDGAEGGHTIYIDPAFTTDWAVNVAFAGQKFGGASSDSPIIIDGSKLEGAARTRGLLYVHAAGMTVENVVIQNNVSTPNSAGNGGGGMYVSTSTKPETPTLVKNVTIKNCSTKDEGNGGGLLIATNFVNVEGCTFENNTAAKDGDQIWTNNPDVSKYPVVKINIKDSRFARNEAAAGNEIASSLVRDAASIFVDGNLFDTTRSIGVIDSDVIALGTGENANIFVLEEIAAPTAKATTKEYDGTAVAIADILDGFDADKMTYTATVGGAAAEEIKAEGEYTITVAPGEYYKFPEGATTTFTYTITAPTGDVEVDAPTLKAAEFEYTGTEYAIGDILNNWVADAFSAIVTYDDGITPGGEEIVLPPDYINATIKEIGEYTITLTLNEGYALKKAAPLTFTFEIVEPDYEAKIGEQGYKTFEEAYAAAKEGDTIVILKDIALETTQTISKAITITTDGEGDKTVTGLTTDWVFNLKAKVTFGGASATSRLIINGEEKNHSKGIAAVQAGGAETTIQYVVFKNNVNVNTGGTCGILYSNQKGVVINNCEFINNKTTDAVKGNGGAFYGTAASATTFNDCVFTGNESARHGGAAYVATEASLAFNGCTFTGNKAAEGCEGGVTYVNGGATAVSFTGCTFTGNVIGDGTSATTGNSIHSAGTANLTIKDSTFTDQTKPYAIKGAFTDAKGNTFVPVKVDAPTLKAETAAATGLEMAVADLFNGWDADAFTATVKLADAEAVIKEAGVYTITVALNDYYALNDETAPMEFTFTLTENEGPSKVLAPTLKADEFEYKDAEYTLAEILNNWDADAFTYSVEFTEPGSTEGGEIILPPDSIYAPIKDVGTYTITLTVNEGYELADPAAALTFTFEIVEPASAVAMIGEVPYTSIAEAVAAAKEGDIIVIVGDDTLDSMLTINKKVTVTTDGAEGGHTIYVNFKGTNGDDGWGIKLSEAGTKFGGASGNSPIIIDGSKINETRARGLLYAAANGLEISNVVVQNNASAYQGGGMYVSTSYDDAAKPTLVENVTVKNCTSEKYAGGLYSATYYVNLENCTFEGNRATDDGDQVFVSSSAKTVNIIGCEFIRNEDAKGIELFGSTSGSGTVNAKKNVFDTVEADAVNARITLGTGENANIFAKIKVDAPTLKAASADETGLVMAFADIFDNWNADAFTATVKVGDADAEIKEPATYTITLALNEDYELKEPASLEYTFTVNEVTEMSFQVGDTQYTTFAEAAAAAGEGGTVTLLKDVAAIELNTKVNLAGGKTIAALTIDAAALPVSLANVTATAVTFGDDVALNSVVFTGDATAQTITNSGVKLVLDKAGNTVVRPLNAVARIGEDEYATLPDAVTAAESGDTIVLLADVDLSEKLTIGKALTFTVDENAKDDITITASTLTTRAINVTGEGAAINIKGTEDAEIIFDAGNVKRTESFMYIQAGDDNQIEHATFKNADSTSNAANGGAALYFTKSGNTLTDCTIKDNTTASSKGGGAMYLTGTAAVKLVDSTVSGNSNTNGTGGAIQGAQANSGADMSKLEAENTVFSNNTASTKGAVIRANGNFSFTGCTFTGNESAEADISEGNNTYAATRVIKSSTFDKTQKDAIYMMDPTKVELGTGTEKNTFADEEITAPTAKDVTGKEFDDTAVAIADILDGFDADKMEATITVDGQPAAEIKAAGEYTITIAPKEGYKFPEGATTTFTYTITPSAAPDIFGDLDFIRSAGENRYATAYATAGYLKEALGVETFDTIVVACGTKFPDALAGSYLATKKNAPIVLVGPADQRLTELIEYVGTNLTAGGQIYILGGESSVTANAEAELAKLGNVKRLAGENRYETNIKILEEAGVEDGATILVADGSNFADALSVSSLGLPILLVKKANTEFTADQLTYIKAGNKAAIIGGTGSVPEVFKTEAERITGQACVRLEGANRYGTSSEIAKWAKTEGITTSETTITVADGSNFPDGLTGGPLAYALGAPLILSIQKNNNEHFAIDYFKENGCSKLLVFGGPNSVSDELTELIMGK